MNVDWGRNCQFCQWVGEPGACCKEVFLSRSGVSINVTNINSLKVQAMLQDPNKVINGNVAACQFESGEIGDVTGVNSLNAS